MEAKRNFDVFVSYSANDRDRVRPLVESLQAAGLVVWWDTRISPGAGFDSEIQQALDASRCVLVIWSESSIKSEWVITEASEGLERSVLVPVCIDDVKPPLAFRRRQTIAVLDPRSAGIEVVDAIASTLEGRPFESRSQRPQTSPRRVQWLGMGFVLGTIVAAAVTYTIVDSDSGLNPPPPVTRTPIQLDGWIDWQTGQPISHMAMSNDGSVIVYTSRDDRGDSSLKVRYMDRLTTETLIGTEGGERPFLSPDGTWVGYFDGNTIKRIPLAGGEASLITEFERQGCCRSASWGEDDRIIFNEGVSGLKAVSITDPTHVPLTQRDLSRSEESHRTPYHIARNKVLLFSIFVRGEGHEVWALDLESGEKRYLLDGLRPMYVSTGHLIFSRRESGDQGSLWGVEFDPQTMSISGTPQSLQSAVGGRDGSAYAISDSGTLVYLPVEGQRKAELILVDANGETRTLGQASSFIYPRLSHDGNQVAVMVSGSIRIYEAENAGAYRQVTRGTRPLWSPDDQSIIYDRNGIGIFSIRLDGARDPEILVNNTSYSQPSGWLDDGNTLLFSFTSTDSSSGEIFRMEQGSEPIHLYGQGAVFPNVSPDERWIAFCVWPEGIVVGELATPSFVTVLSDTGCHPIWDNQSQRLFYQSISKVVAVDVSIGRNIAFGDREVIADLGRATTARMYDIDSRGRMVYIYESSEFRPPVLMTGWQSLLQ